MAARHSAEVQAAGAARGWMEECGTGRGGGERAVARAAGRWHARSPPPPRCAGLCAGRGRSGRGEGEMGRRRPFRAAAQGAGGLGGKGAKAAGGRKFAGRTEQGESGRWAGRGGGMAQMRRRGGGHWRTLTAMRARAADRPCQGRRAQAVHLQPAASSRRRGAAPAASASGQGRNKGMRRSKCGISQD